VPPSLDAIVVGAGAAGLACARHLGARGADVVVLERGERVGGRVRSDVVDGFTLDRGFQVLPTSYPEARQVLDYDRLELHEFAAGAIVRRGGRLRRVADPRRMPVRALRSLAAGGVSLKDAAGVATLLRARDERSVAAALRAAPLSDQARDGLLVPFLRGITLDPQLATSSSFLRFVLQTFADGPAALPAGGMQAVSDQLAEGVEVHLATDVRAVGPGSVALAEGRSLGARAVVVASAGLVDDAPAGWRDVSCVFFVAPSSPVPGPWLVLDGDASGPVNNLCVPTEVAPSYAPPGRTLVSATTLGAAGVDLEALVAQLRGWFGRAVDRWSHLATVAVPHALPALPVGVDLAREPRLAPGLYACGDHREHPSLNGALRSGRRAAEAVLRDLA
jgi:phytoene dehydrogenase-like protein